MKKVMAFIVIISMLVTLYMPTTVYGETYTLSEDFNLVPIKILEYTWEWASYPTDTPYDDYEWIARQETYTKGFSMIHTGGAAFELDIVTEIDGRGIGGRKIISGNIPNEYSIAERDKERTVYGFSDDNDEVIIPPKYDLVFPFYDNITRAGIYKGRVEDGSGHNVSVYKWGYIDKQGNEVIPLEYDFLWLFSEGLAAALKDGKYGFIDRNGKEVIPFIYDKAENFSHGLARVSKGSWYWIDKDGSTVIKSYQGYWGFPKDDFSEGRLVLKDKSFYGCYNEKGEIIVPFEYEDMQSYSEGFAGIKKDGKWGFVDINGNIVIPLIYDSVSSFKDGYSVIERDGKFGIINKNGTEIVPAKYESAATFNFGLACVRENGKYGLVDVNGTIVVPIVHEVSMSFNGRWVLQNRYDMTRLSGFSIDNPNDDFSGVGPNLNSLRIFSNGAVFLNIYVTLNSNAYGLLDGNLESLFGNNLDIPNKSPLAQRGFLVL